MLGKTIAEFREELVKLGLPVQNSANLEKDGPDLVGVPGELRDGVVAVDLDVDSYNALNSESEEGEEDAEELRGVG